MKTPIGTEVDLGPGHIVLDGDPAPPAKEAKQPSPFWLMSIVATPISATAELLFTDFGNLQQLSNSKRLPYLQTTKLMLDKAHTYLTDTVTFAFRQLSAGLGNYERK